MRKCLEIDLILYISFSWFFIWYILSEIPYFSYGILFFHNFSYGIFYQRYHIFNLFHYFSYGIFYQRYHIFHMVSFSLFFIWYILSEIPYFSYGILFFSLFFIWYILSEIPYFSYGIFFFMISFHDPSSSKSFSEFTVGFSSTLHFIVS